MNFRILVLFLPFIIKYSNSASPESENSSLEPPCGQHTGYLISSDHKCGCSGVFVNTYKLRVVFDWWLCEKVWQYALTLLGLFGFAMASPCLKAYREILRSKAISSYVFDCLLTHFILFVFALFVYVIDFLLMLIVMTFNVGVFFAVTGGYAIGYVVSSLTYTTYRNSTSSSFSCVNQDCC